MGQNAWSVLGFRRSVVVGFAKPVFFLLCGIHLYWDVLSNGTLFHTDAFSGFPTFSFLFEHLQKFDLPLWNPYSHLGISPVPSFLQYRFLDPLAWASVWIGHFLFVTDTMIRSFGLYRAIQLAMTLLGIYVWCSRGLQGRIESWVLALIVGTCALGVVPIHQDGVLTALGWMPWALVYWDRIVLDGDLRKRNFFMVGGLWGLSSQTYFGVMTGMLAILYAAIQRRQVGRAFAKRWIFGKGVILGAVAFCFAVLPTVWLYAERGDYVYPLRMVHRDHADVAMGGPEDFEIGPEDNIMHGPDSDLRLIRATGTFGPADFLYAPTPWAIELNRFPKLARRPMGKTTELAMWFGFAGWLFFSVGLIHLIRVRRWGPLVMLGTFSIFILNRSTPVYEFILSWVTPFAWVRNTHLFNGYFMLVAMGIVAVGIRECSKHNFVFRALPSKDFKGVLSLLWVWGFVAVLASRNLSIGLIWLLCMSGWVLTQRLAWAAPSRHQWVVALVLPMIFQWTEYLGASNWVKGGLPRLQNIELHPKSDIPAKIHVAANAETVASARVGEHWDALAYGAFFYPELLQRVPVLLTHLRLDRAKDDKALKDVFEIPRRPTFYLKKDFYLTLHGLQDLRRLQREKIGMPLIDWCQGPHGRCKTTPDRFAFELWTWSRIEGVLNSKGNGVLTDRRTPDRRWSLYVNGTFKSPNEEIDGVLRRYTFPAGTFRLEFVFSDPWQRGIIWTYLLLSVGLIVAMLCDVIGSYRLKGWQ